MKNFDLKMLVLVGVLALSSACTRQQTQADEDSAARKSGKAAYDISKQTEKAARELGRESEKAAKEIQQKTQQAAHDAREGWKDGAKEDKTKHDQ